jgi:hypothetical protein
MKRTRKSAKPVAADAIARLADQGKDVTRFFEGEGKMIQPIQRVNMVGCPTSKPATRGRGMV